MEAAVVVLFFPAILYTEDLPSQITSVADLGLSPDDVPISTETKIVYLVNPELNRKEDLEKLLRASPFADPMPPGWFQGWFNEDEIRVLTSPGRPGDTRAYEAISDVVEQFFKYMFSQTPTTERSLHRIVQYINRKDFPLAVVNAGIRIIQEEGEGDRAVETLVTVRLFMVHADGDRNRNLRWVSRCELCYEDSAVGRCLLASGITVESALSASVLDALRGKIAVSFTHTPTLRRPSGKIEEPRRDLIGRSLSEVATRRKGTGVPLAETRDPDEESGGGNR